MKAGLAALLLAHSALAVDCPPPTLETEASIETLRQTTEKLRPTRLAHRAYISPEEIRTLDTRLLAELLVKRQHEECDVPRGSDPKSDGIDSQSEIVMMVNSQNLASIAKYGFKNQHVTASSKGYLGNETRLTAEQALARIALSFSAKGKELLPKYATFNVKRGDFGTFALPNAYGNVAVVFKPSVRKRTTWTYTDSLTIITRLNSDELLPRTTQAQKLKSDGLKCIYYCEAQVWGDLDLSDVDHLLIPRGTVIPDIILKSGIPIYELKSAEVIIGDTSPPLQAVRNGRGVLLHQGPPSVNLKPRRLDAADLSDSITKPEVPAPVRRILETQLSQFQPPPTLIQEAKSALNQENEGHVELRRSNAFANFVAEIAVRPKTPEILDFLRTTLSNPKAPPVAQAQALYGLSELPWKDLRPLVLDLLKGEPHTRVRFMAVALAADHLDEAEIRHAMESKKREFTWSEEHDRVLAFALLNNKLCDRNPTKVDSTSSSPGSKFGGGFGGFPGSPPPSPVH